MVHGISEQNLEKPNFKLALKQHDEYIEALLSCGLQVIILDADERFPDSVFVEDTAVLTQNCAIISNPGADSRNKEIISIQEEIKIHYATIESIIFPGTLDGGDVMMVGDHFFVGLSERTNQKGIDQFIKILNNYGYTGSKVDLYDMLHLKTGVNYIENNNLLVTGEFVNNPSFKNYNKVIVTNNEAYAANSLWINDKVLVPIGYPETRQNIEKLGYKTIDVDVSEYRKLDGGLSCLSLRF